MMITTATIKIYRNKQTNKVSKIMKKSQIDIVPYKQKKKVKT